MTSSLPDGTASHSYSVQLNATGGSNSYTWSLLSGSLPSGLSLSSSGIISGTPGSASNPVTFTVQVVDTSTPQQHDEATLSLEVASQPEAGSSGSLYSFSIQNSGGGAVGYDPVGNVTGYIDSVNGAWAFTYDSLNRMATGTGSQDNNIYPNYCWQYDNFGNREAQTSSATPYSPTSNGGANACPVGSGPSWGASYNSSNQISGGLYAYDAAGNIFADSTTGNTYLYDAEGRVCAMQQSIDGTTTMTGYLYDAEGHRVAKGSLTQFTCDTNPSDTGTYNGFTVASVYVLGPGGEQMTEMVNTSVTQTPSWQWAHTNVFAPGLSATYDYDPSGQSAGWMYFQLSDWLGTRRQQTDYAGNPCLNFTGLPYGDGLTPIPIPCLSPSEDATEHHFTGKERDPESGNDYFGARYYASSMGRWLSPDRLNLTDDRVLNPANTLNKYVYGGNNPLKYVDPDGKDITVFYEAPSGPTSPGHIMFVAANQQTGDAAAMSFGPVHDSEYGFTPLGSPVNSTTTFDSSMTTDQLRQNFSSLTIQTSPEDAQEVISFIRQLSTSTTPYTLYNTNCTTVCREALKVIGLLPKNNKNWTPTGLWTNLFGRYADPYWRNSFGWEAHQPGRNYGQPRGNYNEFDLLQLLWKPDNSSVTTTQGPATPCGGNTGNPCPK
jgi:RHS repeat-associated protein